MPTIRVQGKAEPVELPAVVCPVCPGNARIAPVSALEAHLAMHKARGDKVLGPGGLTRARPGREVRFIFPKQGTVFSRQWAHGVKADDWNEISNLPSGKHYHLSSEKKESLSRARTDRAWLEKVYGGKDLRK